MNSSRIIAIRDLIISSFSPEVISYEHPYWSFEGECGENRDILMELLDMLPGIVIDGFLLRNVGQGVYRYSVKFSFEEESGRCFEEAFDFWEDSEEEE